MSARAQRRAAAREHARRRQATARRRRLLTHVAVSVLSVAALVLGGLWIYREVIVDEPATAVSAAGSLEEEPTVAAGEGEVTELTVTTLIEGDGETTAAGQTVAVNYVGAYYSTGEQFDSSWGSSETFSFTLGAGEVIEGWDQGLVGIPVGSRVQLDIPSDLAYGDDASSGYPAGPLRFVVNVVSAA